MNCVIHVFTVIVEMGIRVVIGQGTGVVKSFFKQWYMKRSLEAGDPPPPLLPTWVHVVQALSTDLKSLDCY